MYMHLMVVYFVLFSLAMTVVSKEPSRCALCEKAADIQFHPCQHVAMCHVYQATVRAIKKCPKVECRVTIILS